MQKSMTDCTKYHARQCQWTCPVVIYTWNAIEYTHHREVAFTKYTAQFWALMQNSRPVRAETTFNQPVARTVGILITHHTYSLLTLNINVLHSWQFKFVLNTQNHRISSQVERRSRVQVVETNRSSHHQFNVSELTTTSLAVILSWLMIKL